jgi:CdiI immunity protein
MTPQKKEKTVRFDPGQFPTLKEFFSGYLHEDFIDEYGSLPGAARAFRGDASPEESAQACQEWAKLRKILTGRSIPELQTLLQKLGGAWRPQDLHEFHSLDAAFIGKLQKPSS